MAWMANYSTDQVHNDALNVHAQRRDQRCVYVWFRRNSALWENAVAGAYDSTFLGVSTPVFRNPSPTYAQSTVLVQYKFSRML